MLYKAVATLLVITTLIIKEKFNVAILKRLKGGILNKCLRRITCIGKP